MVKFAERMNDVKASDIRELLALVNKPEIISFAGGLPAPELFPVDKIKAAQDAVLEENGRAALQYGPTDGLLRLREQIADRLLEKNGINTTPDHIIMTAGSQQGLDFAARLFVNPGDVVLMESPSYLGAINAFKLSEPTFKEIVNKYEVIVLEDNPYGELRYKGEYLPSLKSMDTKGLVIYLGTFSKILAPGYRLAWMCASEEIIQKINLIAQAAVLQTSTISMMVVSKFIDMFDLDAHVETVRAVYEHRCNVMMDAMANYFPKEVNYTIPDGGLFTWAELPDYIDTKVMATQALAQNVAYVPGIGFFPNGNNHHCMRLNYSCMPDDRIEEGIKRLGNVIRENLK